MTNETAQGAHDWKHPVFVQAGIETPKAIQNPKGGTVISVEELERTKNPACIREGDLCRRNCRPCLLVCRKGGLRSRRNCCPHDRMRAKPALFARGERSFRATDGQGRRRCDPGLT